MGKEKQQVNSEAGIHRVLNYRRKQVEGFIGKRLPQIVTDAFAQYAGADRVAAERQPEQMRREIVSPLDATAFDSGRQLADYYTHPPSEPLPKCAPPPALHMALAKAVSPDK